MGNFRQCLQTAMLFQSRRFVSVKPFISIFKLTFFKGPRPNRGSICTTQMGKISSANTRRAYSNNCRSHTSIIGFRGWWMSQLEGKRNGSPLEFIHFIISSRVPLENNRIHKEDTFPLVTNLCPSHSIRLFTFQIF